MEVKYKTEHDNLTKLISELEGMKRRKVKVGVFEGNHAWLAGIHEYGCDIPVTDKMRKFLHSQGLHLSPNTRHIHIPERSFLRSGHDANVKRVLEQTERALSLVVSGKLSVDKMLDLYGQQMATALKTYARDLSRPPNHPYTTDQKGSSNPLVSTGGMIEGITWEKE